MRLKIIIAFLFLSISSCVSDTNHNGHQEEATNEIRLDSNGEILLKWTVNYSVKKIQFQVQATDVAPPFRWFALGFSDRGELSDSDVCLFWTDYYSVYHYEDMHVNGSGHLIHDAIQNYDMFHFDATRRNIVFERLFDTCDSNDYLIEDDTVHIIWARGNRRLTSSVNLCLTCTEPKNRGFTRTRLLIPKKTPLVGVTQKFVATSSNVPIQPVTTTYWCKVVKQPEFLAERVQHIVQYESTVSPGNEHLVHHIKFMHCHADPQLDIPLYEGRCEETPAILKKCSKTKAAWAYGAKPFTYPAEAGVPIGGPNMNKYYLLEVHYHNMHLRSDIVDSSGLILHIKERRRYDAAIMELGIDYEKEMAIPSGQKAFTWTGYCTSECTKLGLPPSGITVFGSQLHTHLTGRAIWTRHSRDGVELPPLDRDMHFSTFFEEIRILHRPVLVLPGDILETTCLYDTEDKEDTTVGGDATTDEMCLSYIHYYPATELKTCTSSVSHSAVQNYFNYERRSNNLSIDLRDTPRKNYLAIKTWSPNRVKTLHSLYTEFPIDVLCIKSDGTLFQGDWKDQPILVIDRPLPATPRTCPDGVSTDPNCKI